MTKQEFIDTRRYIKMNDKGYSYLEENANHVLDEFIYADKEWKDEVLGVILYDEAYYIFHHEGNVFSTIVGRENFIENDLSLVEAPLWEYVEFEYNAVNNIN